MNFYRDCTEILNRLEEKKGSIKSLVSNKLGEKDRKRGAALIIETLKYKPVLLEVLQASGILQQERKVLHDKNLALLLIHDLLLSNSRGIQAGDGPIKQAILKHKTRLNAEFIKIKVKRGVTRNEELAIAPVANGTVTDLTTTNGANTKERTDAPTGAGGSDASRRWVRINTLKTTLEEALSSLREEGFTEVEPHNPLLHSDPNTFCQDSHVPDLLSFSDDTQVQKHLQEARLFKSGKIIFQDKASCFPAFVLNPPAHRDVHVIDATAAPGNKTSHLSAITKGIGRVTAFERDRKRFQTLQMMLNKAGASNVVAQNQDFLKVDPEDPQYFNVTHILLDPSCSGSGIVNRLDYLLRQDENEADVKETEARLEKLAQFQYEMIIHAMTFPNLQRLVYSTCSIHATENEDVVFKALQSSEAKAGSFRLASRDSVIPSWPRRGLNPEAEAVRPAMVTSTLSKTLDANARDSLIRCLPEDGTNGFFVACFIRDSTSNPDQAPDSNEYANSNPNSKPNSIRIGSKRKIMENDQEPEDVTDERDEEDEEWGGIPYAFELEAQIELRGSSKSLDLAVSGPPRPSGSRRKKKKRRKKQVD